MFIKNEIIFFKMSLLQKLSQYEDKLVRQFRNHPYFAHFGTQSDAQLRQALIQNSFLSRNFVPWYVKGMLGMGDNEARELIRGIILDEMGVEVDHLPLEKVERMHLELLLQDLEQVDINRDEVLQAIPTKRTRTTLARFDLLIPDASDPFYDLKTLVSFRTAGEILVAETYRKVCGELERRYGLTEQKSLFYWPHFQHDKKEEGDHAVAFEKILNGLIDDERKLEIALHTARKAFQARNDFYNQFTRRYQRTEGLKRTGLLAVAVMSMLFLSPQQPLHFKEWVRSLDPAEQQFYHDSDRRMLENYFQTGDQKFFGYIGTEKAAQENWGEGP